MAPSVTIWHGVATCINSSCDWRDEHRGPVADISHRQGSLLHDLAARKHEEAEQHATSVSMHRLHYCKQLGCPEEVTDVRSEDDRM